MRSSRWSLLLVAAVLSVTGCEGHACTLMGGSSGVGTTIPEELWVAEGEVTFTVCADADCSYAADYLPVRPERITRGLPEERFAGVGFDDFSRHFDDGTVQVLVELYDTSGRLLASRRADVELTRYWPNGKDCDGDGYVSGHLDLRPEDAVGAPA